MKTLVVIRNSPVQRFLVDLPTNKLVKEVSTLVAKRRNSQAIVTALTKGRFDREIPEDEAASIEAEMILTQHSVHYDLMGK